jgi:hypothetical protein
MTAVITQLHARRITRGRMPLVPIEYEAALKALAACTSLDEAKYWSNASDALAAWARMYKNDEAGVSARRLKLHAYRRMGELAQQLRPWTPGAKKGSPLCSGAGKGAPSLLMEQGLALHQANAASAAARMPRRKFEAIVNLPRPPAPNGLLPKFSGDASQAWRDIAGATGGSCLTGFRGWCRKHRARELAKGLTPDEAERAYAMVEEVTEWLDEMEQTLKKLARRSK